MIEFIINMTWFVLYMAGLVLNMTDFDILFNHLGPSQSGLLVMTDWLPDYLTDWLNYWPTDWLADVKGMALWQFGLSLGKKNIGSVIIYEKVHAVSPRVLSLI